VPLPAPDPPGEPTSLRGQVAVVTGAGRGIGREIAIGLARAGMSVGLLGRTTTTLDAVLRDCLAAGATASGAAASGATANGATAVAATADVTNVGQLRRALDAVQRELGPADLVVSNAGRREHGPARPWEVDGTDWWQTIETNLRGPFLVARAVLPAMVERGSGRLLHIGSGMAHRPQAEWSAYGVSKAALSRLTDSLAAALDGTGVTVLEVSPGLVRTDLTETMWGPAEQQSWTDVSRIVVAATRFARGDLDSLHGRFVHAGRDDLDALLAAADDIRTEDARALRLRSYGGGDPLA
jgi:3-oxoacyl-[acyl-carrier protein] reductase